jgi:hypothetical protein
MKTQTWLNLTTAITGLCLLGGGFTGTGLFCLLCVALCVVGELAARKLGWL